MIDSVNARYINVFNCLKEGFVLLDGSYCILQANRSFHSMIGSTPENITGKHLADFAFTEDERLLLSTASGSGILKIRIRSFRGSVFPLEFSLSPLTDSEDNPCGFAVLVRDTQRDGNLAEQKRQNLEKYRDMAFATADWLWETDSSGTFVYNSDSVSDFTGYSSRELLGRTPFDLMKSEDAERVASEFNRIASKKIPFSKLISRITSRSGEERIIATSGVPVFDETGTLKGYRGSNRDITEERAVVLQLEHALESARKIIDELPVGVMVVDADKRVRSINRIASRITGYSPEEVIGKICHSILCPGMEGDCPVLDRKLPMDRDERYLMCRNGDRIPVLKSATPVRIGSEDLLLEVFTNAEELKNLRSELQLRNEELLGVLGKASAEKLSAGQAGMLDVQRALITGIVKALNRVSVCADLLHENPRPGEGQALISGLLNAEEILADSIGALRDVQGSLEDLFYRDMELFCLPVLLKTAALPFLLTVSGGFSVIETAIDSSLPDLWYGPARGLNIVLTRLLRKCLSLPFLTGVLLGATSNITDSGSTVPRFSITVSRSLPPFGPDDSNSYESDPLKNSDAFARCRCLLNTIGGELTVRQVSGGNLCIWLDIPLENIVERENNLVQSPDGASGQSALIVAWEADQRRMYSLMLQSLGWKNLAVATCDEALNTLRENAESPQMILVDTDSPSFNRAALSRICREADPTAEKVHIFMVSSVIMPGDVHQYARTGCAALLEKPLRLGRLKQCIARAASFSTGVRYIITDYSISGD